MFSHFDFRALDDPSFKEDAVREELVAPIIRRLGYTPTGRACVQRSKTLVHPFVRIGTRKHPVSIVPDYTLLYDEKPVLVVDAKRPTESVTRSAHVEQAYSYAIHPEIRCSHFALCNGRHFAVFDVKQFEPLIVLPVSEAEEKWIDFEKYLGPRFLLEPALRDFWPDLGLLVARLGVPSDADLTFNSCSLQNLGRVSDALYTASASYVYEGVDHLANFDFGRSIVSKLLECLPNDLRRDVEGSLSRAPFQVSLDMVIEVDWRVRIGQPTQGQHDWFAPFLAKEVLASRVANSLAVARANDIPAHIFRLRDAFEAYASTHDGTWE